MSDCGCHVEAARTQEQRRVVKIALGLNAAMFFVGTTTGIFYHSSGVLADALDMLADASAYAVTLLAIGRAAAFKQRAALASGLVLAVLGAGVILDAIRRMFGDAEPLAWIMLPMATLSLIVNAIVLRLMQRFKNAEVHLRASWIFTRADVIANIGVIAAAVLVLATGTRWPDLAVGVAIGLYVIKEALEILREVHAERRQAAAPVS